MPDLIAQTAFGRTEARRRRFGPLRLAENTAVGLASLALPRGAMAPVFEGLALPGPGQWRESGDLAAFWTGPDQWMVEARSRAEGGLDKVLRSAVPEGAVTEQTYGWVVLDVTSEAGDWLVERLLEKLVNLDPAEFGPGRATRTGIEHMSVFVIRRSPTAFTVMGMRSMADSLWHALESAMARVGEA